MFQTEDMALDVSAYSGGSIMGTVLVWSSDHGGIKSLGICTVYALIFTAPLVICIYPSG